MTRIRVRQNTSAVLILIRSDWLDCRPLLHLDVIVALHHKVTQLFPGSSCLICSSSPLGLSSLILCFGSFSHFSSFPSDRVQRQTACWVRGTDRFDPSKEKAHWFIRPHHWQRHLHSCLIIFLCWCSACFALVIFSSFCIVFCAHFYIAALAQPMVCIWGRGYLYVWPMTD